ncbi:dextranase [Clostridium cavendishii DSM 21758]|uniref:Dextranase n=1 Tax=Clostridium cavendishii DSM 21758 TaxID=1121302 RepID=A0A1M6HVM8_9CLOT|nr:glycoside hydrolase family 66 protein [Clostridium cavendishii]SHJ26164.1 dextranase [Clostridium cavendishii DSM 21758]
MSFYVECYPLKAQYLKNENVEINVEINGELKNNTLIEVNIYNLGRKVTSKSKVSNSKNNELFTFELERDLKAMKGYEVEAIIKLDETEKKAYTAFDVVEKAELCPRYGFMSDFSPKDYYDDEDIKSMNKFHLNIVQYYDWMYRHHEMLPPTNEFIDPLGRKLSIDTVKQKIDYGHKYGMKALGYAAVYGAGKEFFESNKECALYRNDNKVIDFGNFLFIMDINRENPWHDHIIEEFKKAIDFGFDGLHLDQYGFPKEAVSLNKVRHLKDDFPNFIDDVKDEISKTGKNPFLIFNAVNNWPIENVANSKQDVMYIEVWNPNDSYRDLADLINNAKRYCKEKQVVLAAYMRPFLKELNIPSEQAENATLLTLSTIFANGGFNLLLGENNGILAEPYYANYTVSPSEEFTSKLKNYYDFIVKYEELLFDLSLINLNMTYTGGINEEYVFSGSDFSPKPELNKVNTLIKEKENYKVINLVNYIGLENDRWNEAKKLLPNQIDNIEVTALIVEKIKGIYLCSPDFNSGNVIELKYEYVEHSQGQAIKFTIPKLCVWDLVFIETE